jgi:hypothetical protein
VERTGDIFHSPDSGDGERVPSNPYGFACWVRTNTVAPVRDAEPVRERRALSGIDRLVQGFRAAEQEELPPSVPPRIDVQQIVSLKLMKRFLNLRYEERHVKKPPSIYITKTAVDCDFEPMGLCTQLERQARYVASEMEKAIAAKQRPR